MNETAITFQSHDLTIEGRLSTADKTHAAVITHPHPLYGGELQNPVVQTIKTAYQKKNYSTLRFNFRGVGKSQGRYDQGRGEIQDLLAAFSWLRAKSFTSIDLAGYSFGTWINAHAAGEAAINSMIMVSPPVALMDFGMSPSITCLNLVVTGSADEFAPPRLIEPMLPSWNLRAVLRIIDGADHFYFGFLEELSAILEQSINSCPSL